MSNYQVLHLPLYKFCNPLSSFAENFVEKKTWEIIILNEGKVDVIYFNFISSINSNYNVPVLAYITFFNTYSLFIVSEWKIRLIFLNTSTYKAVFKIESFFKKLIISYFSDMTI